VVLTLHDLFTTCPRFFRMPDARRFCSREVTLSDCATCVAPEVGPMPRERLERTLAERFAGFQAELAAADRVLAVSDPQRRLLESVPGFEFRGARVLPIGIHTDEVPPPAPEPVPGKLRLVNWAGLDPRKGVHLILEAVRASERRASFEVHLYGRDGEPEYMRELHTMAEGSNVVFHGPYQDAERREFSGRYDLAVFPFLAFETHALVVDEALRFGIPLIVADHGAPPERIGTRGLAVPPGDSSALREALEGLLADPERLRAMRAGTHGARDLSEHFTELLALYRELEREAR
jgi:glycosyltransferase involved in cell wall biosynthesis